ncbi:MAG: HAD-IC family P-type ATPase [Rikenellaceae bacterium]|nr:HAD-IC family P-type ATPase [Rikenellaceae bacterium]
MRRIVSIAFSASMLLIGMVPRVAETLASYPYILVGWFAAAFLPVGLPVIKEAAVTAFKGNVFSEFTLMSLASLGAFVIGEYPEGVAVMLFYTIGELFQHRAVGKARADIKALLEARKTSVDVVTGAGIAATDPENVPIGSLIEVKAGQSLLVDGVLTGGDAYFDTSAMTGESLPRLFREGERVYAGMIASGGAARLTTVAAYEDSAVMRMMKTIEEAGARKAPAETFMRRFAGIYTPAVTLGALLLVAVPFVVSRLDGSFVFVLSEWIYRAVVFLAVSCPCALVVSIPLSYFGGIGAASRHGVLFKGGGSLDAAASVDTVLFDKTGTLTEGVFTVRDTVCSQGVDPEKLLSLVSGIEAASTHPVARAVVEYAERIGVYTAVVTGTAEIAGYGMRGVYDGKPLSVGNLRLMRREGVEYPADAASAEGTVVACALDGRFMGYILLGDTPKRDAAAAVASLKGLGIADIEIISGDKQPVVDSLVAMLAVTCTGDMLPEDK